VRDPRPSASTRREWSPRRLATAGTRLATIRTKGAAATKVYASSPRRRPWTPFLQQKPNRHLAFEQAPHPAGPQRRCQGIPKPADLTQLIPKLIAATLSFAGWTVELAVIKSPTLILRADDDIAPLQHIAVLQRTSPRRLGHRAEKASAGLRGGFCDCVPGRAVEAIGRRPSCAAHRSSASLSRRRDVALAAPDAASARCGDILIY